MSFYIDIDLLVGKAALFSAESHDVALDGCVNVTCQLACVLPRNCLHEITYQRHISAAMSGTLVLWDVGHLLVPHDLPVAAELVEGESRTEIGRAHV